LWIGTLLMSLGFVMAIVRRVKEGKTAEPVPSVPAPQQPKVNRPRQAANA
jgi:hypothetical protein